MSAAPFRTRFSFTKVFAVLGLCSLLACATACSSRVSTESIRASIAGDNLKPLKEELQETHAAYGELVTALNLARVCQLKGHWRESIAMYEEALSILEEYERRAVISIRSLAAGAGTILFARGSEGYFGSGYERSLLHTFNALNYIMLGDFEGAAVEARRMEHRQSRWLEESQARIEKHLASSAVASPDDLPPAYSMRELLRDEGVRNLLNNYQDAFSYALSAVLFRLVGDYQAADVGMRRAMALDENATRLFADAWPLPGTARASGKEKKTQTAENRAAVPPLPPKPSTGERALDGAQEDVPDTQEVVILAFTGLAPALNIEHVRIWFPAVGYILLDLPAYARPVHGVAPQASVPTLAQVVFYPLLRIDSLAYSTLWDEVRFEVASAFSRALARASVSAGAYAAAASHEDTRAYASLVGTLTTAIMDLFASSMSESVRNWETLPRVGHIAMTRVPRGGVVVAGAGEKRLSIGLPPEARGIIIVVTELSNAKVKVDYVAY